LGVEGQRGSLPLSSALFHPIFSGFVLAGMIVGSVTIYVVKNFISIEGEYFYELLPGFILAFLAVLGVSLLTRQPSEKTLAIFDETVRLVKGD